MRKATAFLLIAGLFGLSGVMVGQDKKDTKKEDPAAKKDDPLPKTKGKQLPQNWSKIGLTDEQKSKVYAIDAKYDGEIDKLKTKIDEFKKTKSKEQLDVLTAEQKMRLEEILKEKAGTKKP